ncbi:RNAse T [Ectothiorhodosinus mongolicus]|uniref:Ribonuclease T n=1 Tax=Ectothiorhodosinus mongolicus TaxID=233100 RepID=A0A1R3VS59_9GAMM|nr:ribonuclease T [Ectothiorhodosinus mongolicus]ULX56434.1 ribonuclease T [Ectothiorhodosinus mongolicus]SIT65972.1 RNAse T [Ectothiorhodosinus mongolicus]
MTEFVPMGQRFRGFLPVVIDLETGGFNAQTDALLQIAAVILRMDSRGHLYRDRTLSHHVRPFEGANMDPKSLEVTGINPYHPLRIDVPEDEALAQVFAEIRSEVKLNHCTRAVLVGHNASFDLGFLNATVERAGVKRNPFHPFSNLDTVTLCAMAYGQTVLARAAQEAGMDWDNEEAHSAVYDAEKTADLFCRVMNRWQDLNGGDAPGRPASS